MLPQDASVIQKLLKTHQGVTVAFDDIFLHYDETSAVQLFRLVKVAKYKVNRYH